MKYIWYSPQKSKYPLYILLILMKYDERYIVVVFIFVSICPGKETDSHNRCKTDGTIWRCIAAVAGIKTPEMK